MTREEAIYRLKALLTMCDFRDAFGDRVDDKLYEDAVAMAIEALKEQQWIPVTERLPEKGELVLVSPRYGHVSIMYFDFTEASIYEWHLNNTSFEYVYAWMPLPDPYKGE